MFKIDKKSLERLSFDLDERDISNFKATLEYLKSNKLLTISEKEIQKAFSGLNKIGRLKLDGKIYAFHIDDSFAEHQGKGDGVELHLRQGDTLKDFYIPVSRDFVYQVDDAVEFLKEHKKSTIYTGEIPKDSNFLGLYYECDEDDPIITTALRDYEVEEFESEGIKVIKLDCLI